MTARCHPSFVAASRQDSQTEGSRRCLRGSADYAYTRRRLHVAGDSLDRIPLRQPSRSCRRGESQRGSRRERPPAGDGDSRGRSKRRLLPVILVSVVSSLGGLPTLGEAIPASPDYRIDSNRVVSICVPHDTRQSDRARGTRLSVSGDVRSYASFGQQLTSRPNLKIATVLARNSDGAFDAMSACRVEYEYRTGEFGLGGDSTEHRLGVGADYSRPLSGGRRASVRVNVAPSTLEIPSLDLDTACAGRVFRMQGDASVDYQFRRTWQASAKASTKRRIPGGFRPNRSFSDAVESRSRRVC